MVHMVSAARQLRRGFPRTDDTLDTRSLPRSSAQHGTLREERARPDYNQSRWMRAPLSSLSSFELDSHSSLFLPSELSFLPAHALGDFPRSLMPNSRRRTIQYRKPLKGPSQVVKDFAFLPAESKQNALSSFNFTHPWKSLLKVPCASPFQKE